ncbi:MAG: N-acetylglucosamine-6-phosphate deacetylase [Lentisphaeria bacterium]|nr:N-acetylglucosamine-6-phosphate deacetylase [Lentisphaeria bacterium]
MSVLLKNGRLISPGFDLNVAGIEIEGARIKAVYPAGADLPASDAVIDLGGNMVMPGFVDIHFHGGMGHEVTDASPEGIRKVAEAKLCEGVTSMCPTTLTLPEEQLGETLRCLAAYGKEPEFAKFVGAHLEGPYINCDCIGAQNPAYVRAPDIAEVRRLKTQANIAIVSFAVEVEGGIDFTEQLVSEGITASCGHTAATYAQLAEAKARGLTHLTHFCNQMTKLHHREIGCVGGGLYDDDLMLEIICDKIHLCPDMIRLIFKLKGCDGLMLITDAMSATGLEDGDYSLGGLSVVVADGAARLSSNGALAGSTLAFNDALRNVYEETGLPLSELVKTCSYNQAVSLGLEGIGRLEPGWTADIVVLDDAFTPVAVFVDGQRRI